MKRSLTNPRILLPWILVVVLFWSVVWAYVDRPRLVVGFGGIGDSIRFHHDEFNNTDARSARLREELETRLKSDEFISALRAEDIRRPPYFQEDTRVMVRHVAPLRFRPDGTASAGELAAAVVDAFQSQSLVFTLTEENQSDLDVMYLFPKSYRVEQPGNSWILWLQARLPGMPDATALAAEAEAANQAVKEEIGAHVQLAIRDSAASCRQ